MGLDESFVATIVQIIDLAAADPNIAPIWRNHFLLLQRLRCYRGGAAHVDFLFAEVAAGRLLSLARTELTRAQTGGARPFAATLLPQGADCGSSGRRFYSTGVIHADYLQSVATTSEGVNTGFIVPRTCTGVQILDDWTGMGQLRISRNRRAAYAELPRFFINARTDLFLQDAGVEPDVLVVEAVHRAKQYIDAGADRIYFAAKDPAYDVVVELAASIQVPLTLVLPDVRNFSNWGALGVTRSSFGVETADVIYCTSYAIVARQKT